MLHNRKMSATIACSIIVLFITVYMYGFAQPHFWQTPMYLLTFSFVIISEILTALSIIGINKSIIRMSGAIITGIYFVMTVLVSFIFIRILPFNFVSYMIINVIMLGITLILNIVVFASAASIKEKNVIRENTKYNMLKCERVVNEVINSTNGKEYKKELNKLAENLRFSDNSAISKLDDELYNSINELSILISDNEKDKVNQQINMISDLINRRNYDIKTQKTFN